MNISTDIDKPAKTENLNSKSILRLFKQNRKKNTSKPKSHIHITNENTKHKKNTKKKNDLKCGSVFENNH